MCYIAAKYILTDQVLNNKMMLIKRFFINLSIIVCTIVVILTLLILSSSKGYLDKPIKKVIEFYLDKKAMKIRIKNLQVRNNILSIDKIFMDLANNAQGEITNFKISFIIDDITTKPLILSTIDIDSFSLISKDNQPVINAQISARSIVDFFKNKIETQLNLGPIKNISLLDSYGEKLPDGEGFCSYNSKISRASKKSINCKLEFGDKAYLLFNSVLDGSIIQATGNAQNIPIMIYQIVEKIIPDNQVILFLQEYMKGGYIRNGEFNFNFDKNSLEKNISLETALKAKLHVVDLEYQYDKDYPPLRKIDTDVTIFGLSVKFILNQAYSSNSLISGGITFDWQGMDKSNFIVNANAKGSVNDLIDFISSEDYNKVKKQGIDLKKITGIANSKIGIIIPISPVIKNTYDISTIITGVNSKAFSDNVILKNAKITGTFNGDKVNLIGIGKINGYDSNLLIDVNVTDNNQDDYQNLLKVKTTIVGNNQKVGILKLISGNSVLDFEYKEQKDGKSLIKANTNLKNLEFYIDKISIHKKLGSEANFTLTGKLYNNLNGDIDFNLSGENNLKIVGKVKVAEDKYDVTLPVIKYNTTDLVGNLLLGKDSLNAKIQGRQLDLSESNMMQFLEKEGDAKNIHLTVDVDRVRLKNNIMLDKLNLQIDCNKIKCFSGSLNSKIGTRSFKMLLTDKKDLEQWIVTCDNAGALFRGIGMYNKMKSGIINLTLDTKRYDAKKGEVIPIVDGTFDIKHFVTTDVPFLTRMVSVVSFPGFMSFILNNKDIMFRNMTGRFSYIGNTINIADTSATGPFFDFTMQGTIDTSKHQMKLKGNVIPSFFFASNVITKVPIIGKIFSKVVPYSMEMKYKE
ncbi:transporter AmpG 3 [Candidatus Tisiphia endosymbiont of Oplodontha viridula]|uniref:transporter AmpG 3 n=1 Tax=Candidatus Tisiphia endosymbiont of Oplodontha viridula TaxID=3077925 RepID=UPI0035C90FA1